MMSILCAECPTQAHYAECHYAECHYAECHYAECHYAECHYAECLYGGCRGALYNKENTRVNISYSH
jgi:hypothetical protein